MRLLEKTIYTAYEDISFLDKPIRPIYVLTLKSKCKRFKIVGGAAGIKHCYYDITYLTHPVYTGQKKFVDLTGQIEKFKSKFKFKFD
jgi:ribosomal protein L31